MPKGRTETIATRNTSRSSGGSGGNGGGSGFNDSIAESLNENLSEVGTIDVMVESATRGGVETVGVNFREEPGIADVSSESGNTYEVDYENGTCNCQHFRYRGVSCRHIEAVGRAMGQVNSNVIARNMDAAEARSDLDRIEDEERNRIFQDQFDDEYFYLDNMDEFEEKLRNGVDVDYEYENVLNGSDITFGIELEFSGGNADAIARDLYNEGICSEPQRLGYHARGSNPNLWRVERDGSVSNGNQGGEMVSPVLQDTPKTWKTIEKICEIAARHGASVNSKCGGHVHVGMDTLDTAKQRWKRLFKIISGYEECIYRSAGGESGRIRDNYRIYATPFAERSDYGINRRMQLNTEEQVVAMADAVSEDDRYYGINLTNISDPHRANTVEFRYFNGSLDKKQIQANVKLAAGVMMAARKARTRNIESIGYEVSDSFKRRGGLVNNYNITEKRSSKKIAEFLDIAFTRKKDKDAILNVFSKNNWR